MANEGKDLRDNTRAMNNLARAILALNDTVIMAERRRREEAQKVEDSNGLQAGYPECWTTTCHPFKGHVEGCPNIPRST